MENNTEKTKMEFYGGVLGSWMPILSLVLFMIGLVVTGHVSLKLFWTAGFFALSVGFLFAKDKKKFNEVALEGLTDPMFSVLCMAFILAGILSQTLRQSGLINGLLFFATKFGLNAALIPVITFLVSMLISTSCGTTGGTVSTVTPIMLPLAVNMGCDPALVLGAIISGGYFGDNLAPISDTTIASAYSNEIDVPTCVRTRIPFSAIAGVTAAILYVVFGFRTTTALAESVAVNAEYAKTVVMLLIPAVMVVLMLKGMDLIPVLIICNLLGMLLNLVMGFMTFETLISAEGPIVAGVEGMVSIVVFCMFLFMVLQLTKSSGAFEELIEFVQRFCKSPRSSELVCACLTIFVTAAIAISTVAIVVVGPIVRQVLKKFNIHRSRGANITDGLAAATAGVLPYNGSFMMATALAFSSEVLPDTFSVLSIPKFSFHCLLLFVVYFASILTGVGRKFETEEQK